MGRKLITEEYISSSGVCSIMDDIEKYHRNGELASDASIREDIAKRIILAEKEQVRYDLIFSYGIEGEQPSILELVDRDALVDAYIADGKHNGVDTVEGMCQYLIDEPLKVCRWLEGVGADIFDGYRRLRGLDDLRKGTSLYCGKPVGELNYREKMLLGMNEIITSLNNESKIGSWLSGGVPDGSSVDEILEFANDDKDFAYMASLFLDIIKDKGAYNGGIYVKGLPLITDESRKAQ